MQNPPRSGEGLADFFFLSFFLSFISFLLFVGKRRTHNFRSIYSHRPSPLSFVRISSSHHDYLYPHLSVRSSLSSLLSSLTPLSLIPKLQLGGSSGIALISMNSLKRRSRPVSVLAEFAMPARIFHMSAEKELELSVGMAISCEHAPSKAPIARPSLSIHN